MIILVGMAAGLLHMLSDANQHEEQMADEVMHSVLAFSPTTFFVVLLPPIIFNSGYHIRRSFIFSLHDTHLPLRVRWNDNLHTGGRGNSLLHQGLFHV